MLVEGGYVVTNAHVVWPNMFTTVAFSDGTTLDDVPTVGWDVLADVAVLGPVDVSIEPVVLSHAGALPIGSEVHTIGCPPPFADPPQLQLGKGIVSRYNEWPETGITYIKSSAEVEGGNSGGALVSETGEVVGLVTAGSASHSLSVDSSDVLVRVESIVSGDAPSRTVAKLSPEDAAMSHSDVLAPYWGTKAYMVWEPAGTELSIALESDNETDLRIEVYDRYGEFLEFEPETETIFLFYSEPYFIIVSNLAIENSRAFTITSSHALIPMPDPEDGSTLGVGQLVEGTIDHVQDSDTFVVDLRADQTIALTTTSWGLDTLLKVDFAGAQEQDIVSDDDSAPDLYQNQDQIFYRAPHTGTFFVTVSAHYPDVAGYTLLASEADPDLLLTENSELERANVSQLDSTLADYLDLRAIFSSLLETHVEFDLASEDLSQYGLELDIYVDNSVSYLSEDPFQFLLFGLYEFVESVPESEPLPPAAAFSELFSSPEFSHVVEAGVLNIESIGQVSRGYWFDLESPDGTMRVEVIFFALETLIAVVIDIRLLDEPVLAPGQEMAELFAEIIGDHLEHS